MCENHGRKTVPRQIATDPANPLPLLLMLLLCDGRAQAAVYKCVDGDGRTRYQASACAGVQIPIDESQPQTAPAPRKAPAVAHSLPAGRGRSAAMKNLFKSLRPCPSTGETQGPCPGYVVDHVKPLACGGADDPRNMQWQTVAEGKAKDQWERIGCQPRPATGATQRGAGGGQFSTGRRHYRAAWADMD
jgi:hypothetical protein